MELSHENGASPDLVSDGPDDVRPDVQQEPPAAKRRRMARIISIAELRLGLRLVARQPVLSATIVV